MTKLNLSLKFAALTLATFSSITALNPVKASTFEETPVEQSQFIAVSQPYGDNKYNLIVIEQIPGKQACWAETGATPVNVDILLLNFDFSGHCRRSTDANGYSIRFNGQDLGLDYLLSIVERNGEIQLIGTNRLDRSQPQILVGTTQGVIGGPMKIQLNPGWRFSKRTYQGKVLGHVYFSYSDEQAAIDSGGMMSSDNENLVDNDNLESVPGGTVQDFVAPEMDESQNLIIEETPINEDSQELMMENKPLNEDSQETSQNISVTSENSQVKKDNYPLIMNRFQNLRRR